MGLIWFLLVGFVVGLLARAILPGDQRMGILLTMGLGVLGSFVGGFVVSLVTEHNVMDFHTVGFIGSIGGAILVLLVVGLFRKRRA